MSESNPEETSADVAEDEAAGAEVSAQADPSVRKAPGALSRITRFFGGWGGAIKAHPKGSACALSGLIVTLLMMAHSGQLPRGPLLGILTLMVGVLGLMSVLGLFDDVAADDNQAPTALGQLPGEAIWMSPRVTAPVAMVIIFGGAFVLGYDAAPYFILLGLAALIPSALRRPGLLIFVIVSGIYLPQLGVYSLWDPWETHYGEVAREILARDDWISLWWAQENWFWSKPILIFWTEALSLGAFGIDPTPHAHPLHPEWAIRLPAYLFSMAATLTTYAAIGRVFNRRAGILAALVLATMPHFFFLAHQAITDMFLVSNIIMAMCVLMLAVSEHGDRKVRRYRLGKFVVSGQHALIFAVLMVVLPQALYLISRNFTFYMGDQFGFAFHSDSFLFGSAGNAGVPGNAEHRDVNPALPGFQPALQGLLWLIGLFFLVRMLLRERRARTLLMFAFYGFCALAFMGKGIPGFALPGMIALLFLIGARRWDLLFGGHLRIARGALMVAVVGLPWYVAMYVRHGAAFTNRLLIHDHINRLARGVHGDTGSIQYFIWQLGYATFPWVGFIPIAVLVWLWYRRSQPPQVSVSADRPWRDRRDTLTLIALWFFGSFALFSAMKTKFHHYIFPAVPPAALLVGIFLDRMLGGGSDETTASSGSPYRTPAIAAPEEPRGIDWHPHLLNFFCGLSALLCIVGVAGLWGDVWGYVPESVPAEEMADWVLRNGMNPWLAYTLIAAGIGALFLARRHLPASERVPVTRRPSSRMAAFGVMIATAVILVAFVGRDLSWATSARPQGYERLLHLFVYNYGRIWPEEFDFRPILSGFAIVSSVAVGGAVFRSFRPLMTRALVGVALCFSAWAINVYMVDLSRHWGLREVIHAYYDERPNADVPLISWQMNWKGENFYTGNGTFVFVNLDNAAVREWITEHDGEHAFFVTEHSRLSGLRSLLSGREIRQVTNPRDCNKFVMVEVTEL